MKRRKFTKRVARKLAGTLVGIMEEKRYRGYSSRFVLPDYERIYLVHIRKTGGTSLNNMFLSLSGEDPVFLYDKLSRSFDHRIRCGGLTFVGWNTNYINRGNYFYGFSHTPLHRLELPERTFTVSCFRDPIRRVVSHYNMLYGFRVKKVKHPCMETEGKWLGDNFSDFLERIPREHLLNQLYMFSEHYDVDEAAQRVQGLSHILFTERFMDGVHELNGKTGLVLKPVHIRKTSHYVRLTEERLLQIREMLEEEYRFLEKIQHSG